MKLEIHVHHHGELEILTQILERLNKMPTLQELKDAVAAKATEVISAIQTAVATETQQVIDKINSIPVGQPITQEDLDSIVASVSGIGTAATTAIDSIQS